MHVSREQKDAGLSRLYKAIRRIDEKATSNAAILSMDCCKTKDGRKVLPPHAGTFVVPSIRSPPPPSKKER